MLTRRYLRLAGCPKRGNDLFFDNSGMLDDNSVMFIPPDKTCLQPL